MVNTEESNRMVNVNHENLRFDLFLSRDIQRAQARTELSGFSMYCCVRGILNMPYTLDHGRLLSGRGLTNRCNVN